MKVSGSRSQETKYFYDKNDVIITKDGRAYKKPSTAAEIGAGVLGLTVANPISKLTQKPFAKMAITNLHNLNQQADLYKEASKVAFNNAVFYTKGVNLVDASKISPEEISQLSKDALPKWAKKYLPKEIKEPLHNLLKKQLRSIEQGKNAAFIPNCNKILVNLEKMAGASFHEMGHALNYNTKGMGKVLTKLKGPGRILATISLFVAAFKRKKVEGEETKGFTDKITTFIKNNAAKLSFLGFVPTLAEEALASIKGAKLAKPLLPHAAYRKMNIANGKAWLTYLGAAVCTALAVRTASWINDKLTKPKQIA